MRDFAEKYLAANHGERCNLLSSWLHGIKREKEKACWDYFGKFNFNLLREETKVDLVRLAVYVEHAMCQRFGRIPPWCLDERLVLKEPCLGRGYNPAWLFFAPQAFYRHNCFFDPHSLEVL